MLVLSRRVNESITIGDRVSVMVAEILGGVKVRLAITAPTEVAVHREEVYDSIRRELDCAGILPGQAALAAHNPVAATLNEIEIIAGRMNENDRAILLAVLKSLLADMAAVATAP